MSELEVPDPEARLAELGHPLPAAPQVAGLYLPAARAGDLVFTSGAIEQAQDAARVAVVNALASVAAETGSLRRIMRVIRLTGYVASAPGFIDQPQVMDAASQLLVDVFGDPGRSARSSVGVAELPLGAPVEIELVVLLR
jgi:enamine deaminase RidA (YjgF/YER057c/UK114 family)